VATLAVAALGTYLGISLAIYSEVDDVPGGLLIARHSCSAPRRSGPGLPAVDSKLR
jgi:hypothetical protein